MVAGCRTCFRNALLGKRFETCAFGMIQEGMLQKCTFLQECSRNALFLGFLNFLAEVLLPGMLQECSKNALFFEECSRNALALLECSRNALFLGFFQFLAVLAKFNYVFHECSRNALFFQECSRNALLECSRNAHFLGFLPFVKKKWFQECTFLTGMLQECTF